MKIKGVFLLIALSIFLVIPGHAEEKRIKIGVIAPFGGMQMAGTEGMRYAEQLARKDFEDVQEKIEVVFQDSGALGERAVTAYELLGKDGGVDVVFCVGDNAAALLAPIAENDGMPFFYLGSQLSLSEGKPHVALFDNERGEFGRALWDELRRQKKRAIALVQTTSPALNALVQGIVKNTIVDERAVIKINDTDVARNFSAGIKGIKKEAFDVLGVFMAPDSARAFLRQAQQAGLLLPLVGDEQLAPSTQTQDLDLYLKDALLVLPRMTDEFQQRYQEKFNGYQGIVPAARFYDFFGLVAWIVEEKEDAISSRDSLLEALRFEDERLGVSGPFWVKTTARNAVYYSFPIALYKRDTGKLLVHRLFERPS